MTEDFYPPYLEPRPQTKRMRVSTCAIVVALLTASYFIGVYALLQRVDRAERLADHYRNLWIGSHPVPAQGMGQRLKVIMPGRLAEAVGRVR